MTERYEITFTEGGVGALETLLTGGIANIAEKTLDTVSGDDNHGWYCHITDTVTGVKVSCWGATKAEAQEIAQYEIKRKIDDFVEEKEREEEEERERRTQNIRQDSPSDDGSSFIGKIIGFLIVAVIVIWLVFTVIIPLVFINIALILLVVGLTKKNWNKFIYPLSFLGSIYVILDFNYGGFTKALAENVPFLSGVIQVLFYINITAGLIATYFFIRNLLNDKNPQIKSEGEFSKRNLIIMSSLLFVGALTIGLQVYFSSKNINKIQSFIYPNSNNTSTTDNDQITPPPPPPNNGINTSNKKSTNNTNQVASYLTIIVETDGKVSLGIDKLTKRENLLKDMSTRYSITFSPYELQAFNGFQNIGVPINNLKSFIYNNSSVRLKMSTGIPIDSKDNQLQHWVLIARYYNPNMIVTIKTNKKTPNSVVKNVIKTLQELNIKNYNLKTD
ncbi:MAG: hypothetical protein HXX16_19225 [Bacteroidales bacterium]|nr:hypothetical protein [Bacteroidales bacterium]